MVSYAQSYVGINGALGHRPGIGRVLVDITIVK